MQMTSTVQQSWVSDMVMAPGHRQGAVAAWLPRSSTTQWREKHCEDRETHIDPADFLREHLA
jgi:hypothetical protein